MTPAAPSQTSGELPSQNPSDSEKVDQYYWLILLALFFATAFAYRNSFSVPFTFDDIPLIVRNAEIRNPTTAWTKTPSRHFGFYTFGLNYQYDGTQVFSYHVVNFAIHLAAGITLFGLVRRTLCLPGIGETWAQRSTKIAGIVALLWLVHPVQTQSVTYVIQRFESLMGLLFLLSLYYLLRGATATVSWPWYSVAIYAGFLGAESKETIVVLPVVAILYDRIFLSTTWQQLWQRRKWVHLGFMMIAAWTIYSSRGAFDPNKAGSVGLGVGITPWEYLRTQAGVIVHYLRLSLWPNVLCIDYRWPVANTAAEIVQPGLVVIGLLALSFVGLRYFPRIAFLGVAFFVLLAPTSSFMPIDDLAVEHRLYLPLACVLMLVVLGVEAFCDRVLHDPAARALLRVSLFVAVAVGFILKTSERNRDYMEPARLWGKAVAVNPKNDRAHVFLGGALQEQKKFEEAEEQYLKAVEIAPNNFRAHSNLGMVRSELKKTDEAIQSLETALKLQPNYAIGMIQLGRVYSQAKKYDTAIEWFRKAIKTPPPLSAAWKELGDAYFELDRLDESVTAYRTAIQMNPRDLWSASRLAWILATAPDEKLRNTQEALTLAETLTERTGRREYEVLEVLAGAQASVGRFDDAITTADEALEMAKNDGNKKSQAKLEKQLERYRARQPAEPKTGHHEKNDEGEAKKEEKVE